MNTLLPAEAWLFATLLSLLACGVFGAIFHSLRDHSRSALEEIVQKRADPERERRLRKIIDDVDGHAASVALARVALSVVTAISAVLFTVEITPTGSASSLRWTALISCVLIVSVFVWIVGTVIPTSIARHLAEPTIYGLAAVVRAMYVITAPLRALVAFIDRIVRALSGRAEGDDSGEIQAELLDVVEEARQEGQLDDTEIQMIRAVARFRDTTVRGIMTPRTDMDVLELTNDLGKVTSMIREGAHSRIPVYEGTVDRVVGVFYIKDLLRWLAGAGTAGGRKMFDLRSVLRPALFVPESKTVRELLDEMLEKRVHIAVVTDEFGGTAGLVTLEDIVEEFFGDVQDEYERPEDIPLAKTDEARRAVELDGRAYVADANTKLSELKLSIPESADYATVGGFVTVALGRIPKKGEIVTVSEQELAEIVRPLRVTILAAEPTRVVRLRIESLDAAPDAANPKPGIVPPPAPAPVVVRDGSATMLQSSADWSESGKR
ncbi:MAG: hemolysin family protein [Phycisphaerales bacterium]|nr:hemolysin family protein [Phycisphaerales bacterium]